MNPFEIVYLSDLIDLMRPMQSDSDVDFSLLASRLAEHKGLPILMDALDRAFADPVLLHRLLAQDVDSSQPHQTNRSRQE